MNYTTQQAVEEILTAIKAATEEELSVLIEYRLNEAYEQGYAAAGNELHSK